MGVDNNGVRQFKRSSWEDTDMGQTELQSSSEMSDIKTLTRLGKKPQLKV
jgi:hypothetical protein